MKLTIYIPTYRRHELAACLESIIPQLTADVELYVSDNDPEQSGYAICQEYPQVQYLWNYLNVGADANCLLGVLHGNADYVWVFGDDDIMLPGAVEATLDAINGQDRIIHVGERHGEAPFGFDGDIAVLLDKLDDKSFVVASTLCTMNVWRRDIMDLHAGVRSLDTRNVLAWAGLGAQSVTVMSQSYIRVGRENQTFFPHFEKSMYEYLSSLFYLARPEQEFALTSALHWNYNNV
jgi:glycosyltransferase involved in cell wall biosynthesis